VKVGEESFSALLCWKSTYFLVLWRLSFLALDSNVPSGLHCWDKTQGSDPDEYFETNEMKICRS
jgi:hypothetical protein